MSVQLLINYRSLMLQQLPSRTPTHIAHWLQKGFLSASLPHQPPIIAQSSFLCFLPFANLSPSCSTSGSFWQVAFRWQSKVWIQRSTCSLTDYAQWPTDQHNLHYGSHDFTSFPANFARFNFETTILSLFIWRSFPLFGIPWTCYPLFSHHYKLHFVKWKCWTFQKTSSHPPVIRHFSFFLAAFLSYFLLAIGLSFLSKCRQHVLYSVRPTASTNSSLNQVACSSSADFLVILCGSTNVSQYATQHESLQL